MGKLNPDDLRYALKQVDSKEATERIMAVLNYVEEDVTQEEIAERYGRSRSWVSRWYKKLSELGDRGIEEVLPGSTNEDGGLDRSKSKYDLYFRNTSKVLQEEYNKSKNIEHNLSKGVVREHFIREFLSNIYPQKYLFSNGEIIDSSGYVSKEVDIAVYDETFPLLEYGMYQQLLAEGVLCHIEIKSELNTNEIGDILNKARDVKNLCRVTKMSPEWQSWPPRPTEEEPDEDRIPSATFAYEGPKLEKTIETLCEFGNVDYVPREQREKTKQTAGIAPNEIAVNYEPRLPDLICVLNQYCIFGGDSEFTYYENNTLRSLYSFIVQSVRTHNVENFSPSLYQSSYGVDPPDDWYDPVK